MLHITNLEHIIKIIYIINIGFALHCNALVCIALQRIGLHCIAMHWFALHCIALVCIALHCIAMHCMDLQRNAIHCIGLYCNALFCVAMRTPSPAPLTPHPEGGGVRGRGEWAVCIALLCYTLKK